MTPSPTLTIVAAVNDKPTLESCLLASPDLQEGAKVELVLQQGFASAVSAYNDALDKSTGEVVVFAHQDVYLPRGWLSRLREMLEFLETKDPAWGVLGVCGLTREGGLRAWVHSVGLGMNIGTPFSEPSPIRLLDEVILIIRRASGLRFDQDLPGFHMYGTDLCLEAEKRGLRNYAIPCFAVHNSNGIKQLPWAFWQACWYVRNKWSDRLPLHAPCTTVSRSPFGTLKQMIERFVRFSLRRNRVNRRVADPAAVYERLRTEKSVSVL